MKSSRAAAVVTWSYVAGFGVATIPVTLYFRQNGRLPSFFGLFDMMAGPWSERQSADRFTASLGAFVAVSAVGAYSGALMWRERRGGRAMNLALLPVEAVFWTGFALPIPWLLGAARAGLVLASLARHEPPQRDGRSSGSRRGRTRSSVRGDATGSPGRPEPHGQK
jgi:hypothetical protein